MSFHSEKVHIKNKHCVIPIFNGLLVLFCLFLLNSNTVITTHHSEKKNLKKMLKSLKMVHNI